MAALGAAVSAPGCGPPGGDAAAPGPEAVRPGIEVLLADSIHLVRGARVGLVTNHTGLARLPLEGGGDSLVSSIELLHRHPDLRLVSLFSPEHGPAGRVSEGQPVPGGRDPVTGLPVHSLYGDTREPLPRMLEGVDVLLYDIQDIGARYYTYISTMALAMRAAGRAGIPFVVLDRPDPIGGEAVQGNVLDPAFATFVGMFPIPMRHGMTAGELARLFRGEFGVEAELHVVPAAGWRRALYFDETGLPWVRPSPNMPDLESALHYPGTCLFEGTGLSVGRGTTAPFRQVGAPWLDGEALARRLEAYGLPGVSFESTEFTPVDPTDGKFGGRPVRGVRLVATDRAAYDPTVAAVAALLEARSLAGERWEWNVAHFDRLAGTDRLRLAIEAGEPLRTIVAAWEAGLARFRERREPYLLYP